MSVDCCTSRSRLPRHQHSSAALPEGMRKPRPANASADAISACRSSLVSATACSRSRARSRSPRRSGRSTTRLAGATPGARRAARGRRTGGSRGPAREARRCPARRDRALRRAATPRAAADGGALEGGTAIWATGFQTGHAWIDVPVPDTGDHRSTSAVRRLAGSVLRRADLATQPWLGAPGPGERRRRVHRPPDGRRGLRSTLTAAHEVAADRIDLDGAS
jgi:hypothetical protein